MKNLLNFNIGSALRRALGMAERSQDKSQPQASDRAEEKVIAGGEQVSSNVKADTSSAPVGIGDEAHNLLIWMIERDRYGVRGRALCTMVDVFESDAVQLCDGIHGYVLNTPNGETVVVEGRTGGLVGHSLETVLDGIREMSAIDLIRQIDSGRKEFDRMSRQELPNALFWGALRMSDEDIPPAAEYD